MKDIILSTPIKSSDLFLGEFIGQLPLLMLFILGIGPLAISLLMQINPDMTMIHFISFYFVFFLMIIFSLLLGTILANWIEHKFLTTKRSVGLSNSFFLLLPFMVIFLIYIFDIIFNVVNLNKDLKPLMNFFPSFWYSSVILFLIKPSFIESYFLNIEIYVILIIAVPIIIAYISYKKADHFYNLEHPFKKNIVRINHEGRISKIIKCLTIPKYKCLVVTQFKEFIRKRENINRLLYIIAFHVFFGFFLLISLNEPLLLIDNFQDSIHITIPVSFFSYSILIILSWMGSFTFGIFMGIYVFSNSKEIIFLYKKSIRNVNALVFSFLYLMTFIIIFNDIILTIFFSIIFQLDFLNAIIFFTAYLINSIIILSQAIAIQCIKPLYNEKGKFIYFNVYMIAILQVISFLVALIIVIPNAQYSLNYSIGLILIFLVYFGISTGIAILFLFLGLKKLKNTE